MKKLHFSIEGAMIVVGCFALLFMAVRLERNYDYDPLGLAILVAGAAAGALLQRYRGGRGILGGALGGMVIPLACEFAIDIWYRLNPQLNTHLQWDTSDLPFGLFLCAIVGAAVGLVIWSVLSNPQLPRVRITIPRAIAGVAIIAIALGLEIGLISKWRRLSAAYHQRAAAYVELTMHFGNDHWRRSPIYKAHDTWASSMAEKYSRLAAYPWLPVGPDPPYPAEVRPYFPEPPVPPVRRFNFPYRPRSPRDFLTLLWNWPE